MAVAAGAVFFALRPAREGGGDAAPKKVLVKGGGKTVAAGDGKKARRVRGDGRSSRLIPLPSKKAKAKPDFKIADDDEAGLTAAQKELIAAIRDALDREDKRRVLSLVRNLQASDEWPDGIPKSIKMAAMDALSWFGAAGIAEIAGFLGDSDGEVVQTAIEKYEEALSDIELSDRERSLILIEAAKFINDADAMDSMMSELNNMRHSVGVETIKAMMENGTAATKKVLPDNIEFFTGEENLDTPEKLDEWLKNNPDGEDDEEFYGRTE